MLCAIDYLGPLPSGDQILVIIDYFSRYKEIKTSKTITFNEIIKMLKEIFSRNGYPITITADNERQFVSEEFTNFCKELFSTTLYHIGHSKMEKLNAKIGTS